MIKPFVGFVFRAKLVEPFLRIPEKCKMTDANDAISESCVRGKRRYLTLIRYLQLGLAGHGMPNLT